MVDSKTAKTILCYGYLVGLDAALNLKWRACSGRWRPVALAVQKGRQFMVAGQRRMSEKLLPDHFAVCV